MKFYSYSKYLISSLIIVACCMQQCVWGQSSTVRPYKFGFTIEEQQHRREMRDERGIVMGEFGFITADGIYHVTVYATDEQGRFRILAMKNYPYESPTKTVEVMVQPKPPPTTTTPKPLPKKNFNTQACAGCSIGNGNNKSNGLNGIDAKNTKDAARAVTKSSSSPSGPQLPGKSGSTATKPAAQGSSSSLPAGKPYNENPPPIMDIIMQKVLPAIMDEGSRTAGSSPKLSTTLNSKSDGSFGQAQPSGDAAYDASRELAGSSVSSASNDSGDLYRFKYILDYHGHTETGKRNGNKEGSYFAIGDDNVERTIQYVANELGYQPRVRWRKLDSNEIKSKENTLKDYEFVWFTK